LIATGFATCPQCGYEFPLTPPTQHDAEASGEPILSDQVTLTKHQVQDTYYSVHTKRNAPADAPKSMRVEYQVSLKDFVSEWVCFEHTGYARQKAMAWWRERSPDPVPDSAQRAVELAEAGALAHTESITVRRQAGERYARIVEYQLGPRPEPVEVLDSLSDDEIPF
jgi:DNA repair protein RadD